MKSRSYLVVFIGVSILVGLFVLASTRSSDAKAPEDVTVVNAPSSPVPTQAQGITNIAGSVQSQQSGPWSVEIAGTPTLNVGNNASSPVPVRDVDNPAHQPFQHWGTFSKIGGNTTNVNEIFVPDGKRLVIETVTLQTQLPAGQRMLAQINTITGGSFAQHIIVLTPQGPNISNLLDYLSATQQVRLYADEGSAVPLYFTRNSQDSNFWSGQYSVSGYFVDVQ